MCSDLQAESYGWQFVAPLTGGGAYCVGALQAADLVNATMQILKDLCTTNGGTTKNS